jgi:hypothetical protein
MVFEELHDYRNVMRPRRPKGRAPVTREVKATTSERQAMAGVELLAVHRMVSVPILQGMLRSRRSSRHLRLG